MQHKSKEYKLYLETSKFYAENKLHIQQVAFENKYSEYFFTEYSYSARSKCDGRRRNCHLKSDCRRLLRQHTVIIYLNLLRCHCFDASYNTLTAAYPETF